MTKKGSPGWLADKRDDPEFQRLCAREDFIEDFLTHVELEMKRQGISRAELARRMECKASNITQMFRRTRNLTAASMVDVAFHLNIRIRLNFDQNITTRSISPLWHRDAMLTPARLSEVAIRPPLHVGESECAMETGWHEEAPEHVSCAVLS